MPKGIDPKAYAARVTQAKKKVAAIDPATKAKLSEYYPNIKKEEITKQILGRSLTAEEKKMRSNTSKPAMKKPAPKPAATKRSAAKPAPLAKAPKAPRRGTATPAPLKGPAAIAELQRQVSPKGVKKAESNVKKAVDKKYPGLYKKSK
jgi:hypothetical protein